MAFFKNDTPQTGTAQIVEAVKLLIDASAKLAHGIALSRTELEAIDIQIMELTESRTALTASIDTAETIRTNINK